MNNDSHKNHTVPHDASDTDRRNPYLAPAESFSHSLLAADTEFLVSDSHIAGGSSMTLPAICLKTAETEDLVQRSAKFSFVPSLILTCRALAIIGTVLVTPILCEYLKSLRRQNPALPAQQIVTLLQAGGAVVVMLCIIAGFALRQRVQVTWYVNRHVLKLHRTRRVSVTVACGAIVVLLLTLATTRMIRWEVTVPSLVLTILLSLLLLTNAWCRIPRPQLLGKTEGLYVLGGMSSQFLAAVRSMIVRYHNRDHTSLQETPRFSNGSTPKNSTAAPNSEPAPH